MPLPDERPRQSVANLIGRFEQQSKRSSLVGASPSPSSQRVSNIVSQLAADTPKDEVKEKREWPPRSSIVTKPNGSTATSGDTSSSVTPPVVRKASEGTVLPPQVDERNDVVVVSASAPEPLSQVITEAPQTSPMAQPKTPPPVVGEQPVPIRKIVTEKKSTPPRQITVAAAPRVSSTPSKTTSSPATLKPQASKVPTASSLSKSPPPSAMKLKPQHTGNSTTSNTSTVRTRSRIGQSSSSFSTPTRPKTPSNSRPKTPASGLYAPTAASLAKARNAAPPVPTPTRKPTVSASAVTERLSKPTAASASKMRSPSTPLSSPARSGALKIPQARGAGTASAAASPNSRLGATVKPRVGLAPARMKEERERKEREAAAASAIVAKENLRGSVTGPAVIAKAALAASEEPKVNCDEGAAEVGPETEERKIDIAPVNDPIVVTEEPTPIEEHEQHFDEPKDPVESYDEDFADESIIISPGADLSADTSLEADSSFSPTSVVGAGTEHHFDQESPLSSVGAEESKKEDSNHFAINEIQITTHVEEEPKIVNHDDDLENIVNMLEATSFTKRPPSSVSNISMDEIPDEE